MQRLPGEPPRRRRHGSVGRVAARFSVVGGAMFSCRPPSGAQPLCCSGCNRCGTPACGVWGVLDGLNKVSGPGLDAIRTGGKTLADRVEGQLLLACAITAVQFCWQCDSKKLLARILVGSPATGPCAPSPQAWHSSSAPAPLAFPCSRRPPMPPGRQVLCRCHSAQRRRASAAHLRIYLQIHIHTYTYTYPHTHTCV